MINLNVYFFIICAVEIYRQQHRGGERERKEELVLVKIIATNWQNWQNWKRRIPGYMHTCISRLKVLFSSYQCFKIVFTTSSDKAILLQLYYKYKYIVFRFLIGMRKTIPLVIIILLNQILPDLNYSVNPCEFYCSVMWFHITRSRFVWDKGWKGKYQSCDPKTIQTLTPWFTELYDWPSFHSF